METQQNNITARGTAAADLVSALPDLALGGLFLLTWISPYAIDEKMLSYLVLVVLMEFIIIHSSGFLGVVMFLPWAKPKRLASLVGLGLFYTMFVSAFCVAFGEWWPLGAFWLMIGNRLLGVLLGQSPEGAERGFLIRSWALSVFFYILAVFAPLLLTPPEFGITSEAVARQSFEIGGEWTASPQIAIASGFLYFSALGVSELFGHRWLVKATEGL